MSDPIGSRKYVVSNPFSHDTNLNSRQLIVIKELVRQIKQKDEIYAPQILTSLRGQELIGIWRSAVSGAIIDQSLPATLAGHCRQVIDELCDRTANADYFAAKDAAENAAHYASVDTYGMF